MHRLPCFVISLLYYVLFKENQAYRNLVVPGLTTATQSSTYLYFSADRSIDGYPDRLKLSNGSCSHTGSSWTNAWLRIDLDKVYNVKEVKFWYRNHRSNVLQNTIRLHYYSLLFYNMSGSPVECYRDNTNYSTPIPMPFTVECPSKTRTIEFHTTQPNPEDGGQVFLEICEVEIYGCEQNQYGENCTSCSNKCTECDITKGCVSCQGQLSGSSCELCPPGYMESNCDTACAAGWYGNNCSMECSGHCFDDNNTCFHKNGSCLSGCTPGYTGSNCSEECPFGTFGPQCNSTCGDGCKNKACHSVTGKCVLGCIDGRFGGTCDEECPFGTFGPQCNSTCGNGCKDKLCHSVTGKCALGCIDGWIGDTCDEVCREGNFGAGCLVKCGRCVNNTCDHVNGSCSGPCQDGWEGERCLLAKDDLESPLKRSYSFLLEAVAGTGALVAVVVVSAILFFWMRHKKTHFIGKKSAHADEKDLEQEMSLHPETSGIYENQDVFSSSAERRNSSTQELSNNLTDREMYEVLNQDERSTEEYDTLSNNHTDQPMYEMINKGERSTEEYDTLEL
ncbi:multiple epidermal growth factor-like domains protein 11 isoform X4 [Crassostrea angulata]|uniref:multiple epidermal growth factor-like domains protein 11 isoform X4 n=1 Tax=Magallana angulata TaxID=2784310 RepID=UPI0022B13A69|nr:multiple epidermal growth factor-like domains protein 11 isoform X4 [Crassostrea angulata]